MAENHPEEPSVLENDEAIGPAEPPQPGDSVEHPELVMDKDQAREMAVTELPYQVVLSNARKAVANGVEGMERVIEELSGKMDESTSETAKKFDTRKAAIEDLKSEMAKRALHVAEGGSGNVLVFKDIEKIEGIAKDEIEEVRGVAYGLFGMAAPAIEESFDGWGADDPASGRRTTIRSGEKYGYSVDEKTPKTTGSKIYGWDARITTTHLSPSGIAVSESFSGSATGELPGPFRPDPIDESEKYRVGAQMAGNSRELVPATES